MRKRNTHINIRTTPEEKARFEKNANICGLSLSEYLRMLANRYEPKQLPPLDFQELKDTVMDLHLRYYEDGDPKYANLMIEILKEMIASITPAKNEKFLNKTGEAL